MPALSCIELSQGEQAQLKALVWQVLRSAMQQQEFITPPEPKSKALLQPAASFVSIYVNDELRGCVGSYLANKPLWLGVCEYSYCSAFEDGRFTPLGEDELAQLSFQISILSPLTPIENLGEQALLDELDVGIDGLLLKQLQRHAIFLPVVWRSLQTPERFVQELKKKGGWDADYWSRDIELFRFYTFVCL